MTTFDDEFAATAGDDLLDEFGESITYTPRSGSPRSITAIVNRNPVELVESMQDVTTVAVIVRVLDDSTDGISAAEVDMGGDRVLLPIRSGDTAEYLALKRIISDNGGFISYLAM